MALTFVITMANSIIGVAILTMPFCFQECGILLATLLLVLSGLLVKMICHLMLKSAILARRRTFETLAFHTFGNGGKLLVELLTIGYLIGTSIAFFVVMGDLAPPIFSALSGVESSDHLRSLLLVCLGIFVTLPLALLKNVESLAVFSTASIIFYSLILCHIVFSSYNNLIEGSWTAQVSYWRIDGVLQCIPIFVMALACQPQLFEIYESLPEPSLGTMNDVIRSAVNFCTGIYIFVGVFGYIAFSSKEVGGNILNEFPPSLVINILKIGFVLSVAVSFPMVIFPCRSSIYSLIYKRSGHGSPSSNDMVSNYIPPLTFNIITILIIILTLVIGILIPDVELILGLVGSLIGCVITIIFPSIIFIRLTHIDTTERLFAKIIFILGLFIMITGTYVNLKVTDIQQHSESEQKYILPEIIKDLPSSLLSFSTPLHHKKTKEQNVDESKKNILNDKQAEILFIELEKQKNEHEKILKEQKEILKQLKEHVEHENENIKETFKETLEERMENNGSIDTKEPLLSLQHLEPSLISQNKTNKYEIKDKRLQGSSSIETIQKNNKETSQDVL